MKNPLDPRHLKREKMMIKLFEWGFPCAKKRTSISVKCIIDNMEFINKYIKEAATDWPVEQISKIDLSILRLAVFEMAVKKKEPVKVIIDEAIELAKKYGSDTSPSFINGALGSIYKTLKN